MPHIKDKEWKVVRDDATVTSEDVYYHKFPVHIDHCLCLPVISTYICEMPIAPHLLTLGVHNLGRLQIINIQMPVKQNDPASSNASETLQAQCLNSSGGEGIHYSQEIASERRIARPHRKLMGKNQMQEFWRRSLWAQGLKAAVYKVWIVLTLYKGAWLY